MRVNYVKLPAPQYPQVYGLIVLRHQHMHLERQGFQLHLSKLVLGDIPWTDSKSAWDLLCDSGYMSHSIAAIIFKTPMFSEINMNPHIRGTTQRHVAASCTTDTNIYVFVTEDTVPHCHHTHKTNFYPRKHLSLQ